MLMTTIPHRLRRPLPRPGELYQALLARDPSYEGIFIAGVRTTGIFCRPTCPAKKPKPENVEFFATTDDAAQAGHRPCLRCQPLEQAGSHPDWVRRILETLDENPAARLSDSALKRLGAHPAAARRYFVRRFGMTLQGYARSRRLGIALHALQRGTPVLPAGFGSGFESGSGVRDAVKRLFGVTPTQAPGIPPILAAPVPSPPRTLL